MNNVPIEFIAVDIGNTRMNIGVYGEGAWRGTFKISSRTPAEEMAQDLAQVIRIYQISSDAPVVIASVKPAATEALRNAVRSVLSRECIVLTQDLPVPVENRTKHPDKVGPDRLVNALAAFELEQRAVIVVDFGTAITFDVVSQEGAYLGGTISPGVMLAVQALHQMTALLPLVRPEPNPPVLGDDTLSAINSGIFHGYVGMVTNILDRLVALFPERPRVLATGGDGDYFAPEVPGIDAIVPRLTLDGIRISWERRALA